METDMNERIKQLAEQAGWDNHHAQFDTRIDKFANLIIQDCADFLKDNLDDHFAAEQLEEHFGVEE
jgi:hypothetical protein